VGFESSAKRINGKGNDLIGSAEVGADGSVTLHLHTLDEGPHGDAVLSYDQSNPMYDDVMSHLVGQGRYRKVQSWADPGPNFPKFREQDITGGDDQAKTGQSAAPQAPPPETAQFHTDVQTVQNNLPPEVTNLFAQHHISTAGVRKVTDEAPELAGQHPRGWPQGTTWDNCDGVYDTKSNTVVVAYEHLDANGNWIPNSSVAGVLRHETGHGFNYALGKLSDQGDFTNAYNIDKAAMPQDAQKRLTYFLQPGSPGRDESCADVFAHIEGGASFPSYDKDIGTYFPNVASVVKNHLAQLPKPPAPTQPIPPGTVPPHV
jgi:hypothetical protein